MDFKDGDRVIIVTPDQKWLDWVGVIGTVSYKQENQFLAPTHTPVAFDKPHSGYEWANIRKTWLAPHEDTPFFKDLLAYIAEEKRAIHD
jgi:hypothetical protein